MIHWGSIWKYFNRFQTKFLVNRWIIYWGNVEFRIIITAIGKVDVFWKYSNVQWSSIFSNVSNDFEWFEPMVFVNYQFENFMFRDLTVLRLQSGNWLLYRKVGIFDFIRTQDVLTYKLFVLFTVTEKVQLGLKMKLNRWHFLATIFYDFRCEFTQQHCMNEVNSIFGDKAASRNSVYGWYSEFNCGGS